MPTYKFRSNISCGNCVSKVAPFLNDEKAIEKWEVNTSVPEKTLTIISSLSAEQIAELVKQAGYTVTLLQ